MSISYFRSFIQFFFWSLVVLCGIPTLISSIRVLAYGEGSAGEDHFRSCVRVAYFFLALVRGENQSILDVTT